MIEHDSSLVGKGTTAEPLKVNINKARENILQLSAGGLSVDGTHHIIPKMGLVSVFISVNEPMEVYPDGGRLYRETFKLTNYQRRYHASSVSVQLLFIPKLEHYLLDTQGNRIYTEVFAHSYRHTIDNIEGTVEVFMSAKPVKACNIVNDKPWPSQGGILTNFKVELQLIMGFTPYQLEMGDR